MHFRIILSVALISLTAMNAVAQRYTCLALEGGGIRGIAYAGAFEELEKSHVLDSIRNVAGTSVGAVAGCLVAVGYSAQDVKQLLFSLKIQSFNDGHAYFFGGQWRMRKLFGWYNGDVLERWIEARLASKTSITNITFGQLHELAKTNHLYKDLFVTASNLSTQRLAVFSWKTFPEMSVATSVRASMSVPLYFKAMRLDKNGGKAADGDVYVDGGLVLNYPINVFDSGAVNRHTLGLKLERPEQLDYFSKSDSIAPYPIHNLKTYIGALYNFTIETLNRQWPMKDEMFRTIYISTANINPRVRKITREQKMMLYESGRKAAQDFLQKQSR